MLILREHFTRYLETVSLGKSWKKSLCLEILRKKLLMFIQTMTLFLATASQIYKLYHY